MPFEKFTTAPAARAKKTAKSTVMPNSVVLPQGLFEETAALALQYTSTVERVAEEAMTIGLRAIKARNDAFNRRAFTAPEPVETV